MPRCHATSTTHDSTSRAWPNTTCFPSSQGVEAVQRKNWLPFVLGPGGGARAKTAVSGVRMCCAAGRTSGCPARRVTCIRHGQHAGPQVLQREVFVREARSIDGLAAGAVVSSEVAALVARQRGARGVAGAAGGDKHSMQRHSGFRPHLAHEGRNHAVEAARLIAHARRRRHGQLAEVLSCLGHYVLLELHHNASKRRRVAVAAERDVKVHERVGLRAGVAGEQQLSARTASVACR